MSSDAEQLAERYKELFPESQKVMDGGLLKLIDVLFFPTSLLRLKYTADKAGLPIINGWLMSGLELLRGVAYTSFVYNPFS